MSPELILGATIVVPFLVIMLLRINAVLVFLSLCLGAILVQFVASDAQSFTSLFAAHNVNTPQPANITIRLGLLLFPAVLTMVIMIRTVRGRGRLLINAFPAAGVGLLAALLVVPILPVDVQTHITGSSTWQQITRAQDLIVGVSALMCLAVLWLQRPKVGEGKSGKHKG